MEEKQRLLYDHKINSGLCKWHYFLQPSVSEIRKVKKDVLSLGIPVKSVVWEQGQNDTPVVSAC